MNFRAASRALGSSFAESESMDSSQLAGDDPGPRDPDVMPVRTDGQDPATPGGPAPYNGAEPERGEPVASNPEWHDPLDGDTEEQSPTLHNARRRQYATKTERVR